MVQMDTPDSPCKNRSTSTPQQSIHLYSLMSSASMAAEKEQTTDDVRSLDPHSNFTADSSIISLCQAGDLLCAGSDDGNMYIWKGDSYKQGVKAHAKLKLENVECVNCICYLPKGKWLIGCGDTVYFLRYDSTNSGLVVEDSLQLADEINEIQVNEKLTYAAAADDSGCLTIIDLKTRKIHKRLLGHENICSCVKFRPKSPWSVVTGGLDCMLILWDFKKEKALGSVNMADTAKQEQTDKDAYVVNPPLIHCLDMTSDGLIAAAGLENGKIILFTIGGKGFKPASTIDAHSQGVSSVHLLDDMTMMSSGNDSELKIWKLSTARAPGKTLVWASPTHTAVLKGKPSSMVRCENGDLLVADESPNIALYRI